MWSEEDHPRNTDGEFTHSSVGSWVKKVAAQLRDGHEASQAARIAADDDERPPGWQAAKVRLQQLWRVPDTRPSGERTDAEQDELEALEQAFEAYRGELGLKRRGSSGAGYQDEEGNAYSEHGEPLGFSYRDVTDKAPHAMMLGYTRVGDHPERVGSVHGSSQYMTPSTHPKAGGLWIDPKNPGTRHSPHYRNDMGHGVSALRKPASRSERHKEDIRSRRRDGGYGGPRDSAGDLLDRERRSMSGAAMGQGRLGYGLSEREGAEVFIGAMKRKKARARIESAARTPKRRTPWAERVNRDMARRAGGQ